MTIELSIPAVTLIAVLWASVFALLWRQTGAMQSMSILTFHRRDREQVDESQLIEKLVEKLYNPENLALSRQHALERLHVRNLDAAGRDHSLSAKQGEKAMAEASAMASDGDQFCDAADAVVAQE